MRVFLTGASGFIGTRLVPELLAGSHGVLALAQSEDEARSLIAAGCDVHHGSIEDLASLRGGCAAAEGVIHCAFNNDFEHLAEACAKDRIAVEAMGDALAGSDRPLIVSSFTGLGNTVPGEPAREDHDPDPKDVNPRVASEFGAAAASATGANVSVMRLPMVHDPLKQGIITAFIALARKKGVSAYVGYGANRFPSAPVLDVATLYRLALEKREHGARYHAVAEEGVSFRGIAEIVGRGLDVPVVSLPEQEAKKHFTFLADFAGRDLPASSAQTREKLNWHPTGPSLMSDLEQLRF